jgi:hypothetical protein
VRIVVKTLENFETRVRFERYGNEIAPSQNSVSGCNGKEFDRRYAVAVRPGQALSGIRVVASSEGCRSGGERGHSSANLTWPKFFTAVQI